MVMIRRSNNNFIAVYTLGNGGFDTIDDDQVNCPMSQATWVGTTTQRQFQPTETIHSSRLLVNVTANTNSLVGGNVRSKIGDPPGTFTDANQIVEVGTGTGVFIDVAGGVDVMSPGLQSFQWQYNFLDGTITIRGISSRAQTVSL